MYSPQKDKTLSTSKKEVKNDGTCNQLNPTKIDPKNTHSKLVLKISSVIGNLIAKIQQRKFRFKKILVKYWF